MRRIVIGLVFASVAAVGCSRANATESAGTGSPAGNPDAISTAQATKKKDALEIGGGAAGGALIGGLIGGKKGALIGTAAGGGAGTAVVLSTRGKEIHLPRGSAMTLKLLKPLTVRVKE